MLLLELFRSLTCYISFLASLTANKQHFIQMQFIYFASYANVSNYFTGQEFIYFRFLNEATLVSLWVILYFRFTTIDLFPSVQLPTAFCLTSILLFKVIAFLRNGYSQSIGDFSNYISVRLDTVSLKPFYYHCATQQVTITEQQFLHRKMTIDKLITLCIIYKATYLD